MTDRRASTLCAVHGIPFLACPCEERRATSPLIQVVGCDNCGRHFTLCVCDEPDLQPRGAV
jgi:hypothetical protein